ncbi:MAG: ATP-binding protein, partial [Deltaproteobacteria bacterium]|nr:ATP-binding protein [Deltaproteobacteria bacterium]
AGYDQVDLLAMAAEEAARAEGEIEVVGPPDGAPALLGDARSLRHLLRNLITNAERHAPGCQVEIRIDPLTDGPGVRISVADRGPGISETQRQAVFDAFTRGNGAAGGLGLGLAIVRQVARHHGGEARAMGRPDASAI